MDGNQLRKLGWKSIWQTWMEVNLANLDGSQLGKLELPILLGVKKFEAVAIHLEAQINVASCTLHTRLRQAPGATAS